MRRRRIFKILGSLAIPLWLVTGHGHRVATAQQTQSVNLTVSAAISLTNALRDLQALYQRSRPNVTLTYNFGASGALQQQIEQGAPADLFFSAGERQMDALESANLLLPGTRRNLLGNRLVLVTPRTSSLTLTRFQDLSRPQVRRIAIGEPRSVPAGQYAQEVLTNLRLLESLRPKLVFAQNVRQVLSYVETGNVDAGMVYATDARESERVRLAATAPANSHSPIVYPIAVVRRSQNAAAAREFVAFLASAPARAVFQRYGFSRVN